MSWSYEAQASESTTNVDHCDEERVQTMLNHCQFAFYHYIIVRKIFLSVCDRLHDGLMVAVLSVLLATMANWQIRL